MSYIKWNEQRGRWVLFMHGQPAASSLLLRRLTRRWPDAEVQR